MGREDYAVFDELRKQKQKRRARRLAATDDYGWTKHTETHWSRMLTNSHGMRDKLDYWPSSNKWLFKGKYYRGGLPKWIAEKVEEENKQLRWKEQQ